MTISCITLGNLIISPPIKHQESMKLELHILSAISPESSIPYTNHPRQGHKHVIVELQVQDTVHSATGKDQHFTSGSIPNNGGWPYLPQASDNRVYHAINLQLNGKMCIPSSNQPSFSLPQPASARWNIKRQKDQQALKNVVSHIDRRTDLIVSYRQNKNNRKNKSNMTSSLTDQSEVRQCNLLYQYVSGMT